MRPRAPIGIPTHGRKNVTMIPTTIAASATPIMGPAFPGPETRNPLEIHDDETLFGQLAYRVRRALAGVPRRLDAAVGHLVGAEGRRLVDRHAAEVEPPRR